MKRQLILENGEVLIGNGFGATDEKGGEVVFNTSMSGYQEILSDATNAGQIIVFTNPQIGNYGLNRDDFEAISSAVHGVIVKEYEEVPSHWRESGTLEQYLIEQSIPGLKDIDTRKLTRIIRNEGTMRGRICGMDVDVDEVIQQLKAETDKKVVERVSTKEAYRIPGKEKRVVVIDLGVKRSIIQQLSARECDLIVVPYHTSCEEILRYQPDGVLISNGPGSPTELDGTIETVKQLFAKNIATFGIGLGFQLIALAAGANVSKLLFGHRGVNYPVRFVEYDQVLMTTQNHSYAVDKQSVEKTSLQITHIGVNDDSIEGIKHEEANAFGVQFIPGSYEGNELYDEFLKMMELSRRGEQ